ncbi:MAG TPA: ABC transporter ATP-binding protein [Kofleriaceae bacterium]|nr:ABC transporter ATP-binding protein [Kofleriaceae bacterium]
MSTNRPAPPPASSSARSAGPPMRGPMGMTGPPQKAKNFGPSMRRLIGLLAPQRKLIVFVLAFAIASVSLSVAGPKVLGHATDIVFKGFVAHGGHVNTALASNMNVHAGEGIDFDALAHTLILVMALYIGASVLMWLQSYILNYVVQRTIRKLRADVDAKLMRVPLAYFDRQPHGEVLSRVTNDIDNVAMALQQTMSQILIALLTVVGILVMLVWISPLLSVIALVTVPISVMAAAKIGKRAQKGFIAQWKHVGVLNGQIEEAFTGHALVKVFGRRKQIEDRFRAKNDELFDAGFRAQFISSLMMPVINFVGNLTYITIAVVGALRVATGKILLGSVQAFIQYSRQFTQQLSQLAQVSNILQSGVASAERVFELLDEADQSPDRAAAFLPHPLRGEVRFEDVSFRYKPEVPLIEKLSLVASAGQTVAIVGPTGAGKTTLVNLLMRFYDLDDGAIRVDGVDIATAPRADVRARFGMVLQDTWLFGGTIRDNIKYGSPKATEDDMLAAAKATYVDRFVRALPDGYDTVIDEESSNLSTGEKQLITIARAFLANPAILILDEATSSVDTRTEVLVQRAMATLRERRTSFVIAHRLSTIRDADIILVMEQGKIVEQGTHEQLLAAGGAYHTLYHAQFAAPAAA